MYENWRVFGILFSPERIFKLAQVFLSGRRNANPAFCRTPFRRFYARFVLNCRLQNMKISTNWGSYHI